MPRPRRSRIVRDGFSVRVFKPQGVPMREIKSVVLCLDGAEALRLADAEGLEHAAAAEMMGISRPTFSRLLAEARTTVASALVGGWAIEIAGGAVDPTAEPVVFDPPGGMRRRRGHRRCAAMPGLSTLDQTHQPEQETKMPNHDGTGPHDGCGCGNGKRHQDGVAHGHGHGHGRHAHGEPGAGEHCGCEAEAEAARAKAAEEAKS
jgi:uncharacterized protein